MGAGAGLRGWVPLPGCPMQPPVFYPPLVRSPHLGDVRRGPAKMQGVGRGCGGWDCHGNPRRGMEVFLGRSGSGGSAALGQGDE